MFTLFAFPAAALAVIGGIWMYDLTKSFRTRRATRANLDRVLRGA